MKKFSFLILFVVCGLVAHAQKLSANVDEFQKDLPVFMASANNSFVAATSQRVLKHLNEDLPLPLREKIAIHCNKLVTKHAHKASPHLYFFFEMLLAAIEIEKLPNGEIENLLTVSQKVVETTDLGSTIKWYEMMKNFYTKRMIFASNFNRLYIKNAKVTIRYAEGYEAGSLKALADSLNIQKTVLDDWDQPIDPLGKQTKFAKKPMPKISGPIIEFTQGDLILATATDSAIVKGASGAITTKEGVFVGFGGKISWETAGIPQAEAQLGDFTFVIRNPRFTCDEATFTYNDRLQTPLKGIFEYKSEKRPKTQAATYPRFMSYTADAQLKGINQNIEYRGGFSMSGRRIFSSAVNDRYASIVVKNDARTAFKTTSAQFEMSDSLISASQASYVMMMDKDSVTHPAIKLNYDQKRGVVRLFKIPSGGFKDTPFFDSFHQLDINADGLVWDMKKGRIDFSIVYGKNVVPAVFESVDYFSPDRISEFNGTSGYNPVLMLGSVIRKSGKDRFTLKDLNTATGINNNLLKGGMASLLQKGYVSYDPITEYFRATKKLNDILLASNGKKDFDNFMIRSIFNSKDTLNNATLDLKDKVLKIRGVKTFTLSDSLRVYVYPKDETVSVFQNRNFEVTGNIKVGNFRFAGQKMNFDYNKFDIKLTKIDSINFIPQKVYRSGGNYEIGGYIRFKESGMLYLNEPSNKSGRLKKVEYPRLVIPEEVAVYFDQPNRKVKYGREVVFKIPGIDYDSLNVKDAEFVGTFYSGNIFQPFKEKVIVMADTSLGFIHPVINQNYQIYGKSTIKFDGNLTMNLQGLTSKGSISHLAANLLTDQITFGSDTLKATGKSGEIVEGIFGSAYFPKVAIKDFSLMWSNRADSMKISAKTNFQFYQNTTSLAGDIVVRNKGLFGRGKILRTDSEAESQGFQFNKDGFTADTAKFDIKSIIAGTKPVFQGSSINLNFNVNASFASVSTYPQVRSSSIEYPYAAYRTTINKADWNIKDKKISMKGPVETSIFASTNPTHEGLNFNGSEAIYDISKEQLNIGGIPFIKSADAKISPDKGNIVVKREGEIQSLSRAHLVIDTLNGYHKLINGNIQIQSRLKFFGDATYQYVNVSKDTFNIKMGNFELKETTIGKNKVYSTQAKAIISERDGVYLSPKVIYRGEMTMIANEKNLFLDGFVRPELKKFKSLGGYWIAYKGNKSENVAISVNKDLKAEGQEPLVAGLVYRTASTGLYPAFLSPKESESDAQIFSLNGVFERDESSKQFVIKEFGKNIVSFTEENTLSFVEDKGLMTMSGKFNLATDAKLQQSLQIVGKGVYELDSNRLSVNTMMVFNPPIATEFYKMMAEKLIKAKLDGNLKPTIQADNVAFLHKLAPIVGVKEAENYRARATKEHVALNNYSSVFAQGLVLSDVNFKWSDKYNAFYSVGELGLSNLANNDINAKVNGMIELRKLPNGDELNLYLEASPDVWYYISYKDGTVGVFANDVAFNDQVTAKIKNKKDKKKNQMDWIEIGPEEKPIFVNTFKEIYLNQKKPKKPAPKN